MKGWPEDWGQCFTCGELKVISQLSAGHFREKIGGASTYFELDNLRPQCFRCNKLRHGEKDIYAQKLLGEIGRKRFDKLFKKVQEAKQWTKAELTQIAEEREKEVSKLNNKNMPTKKKFREIVINKCRGGFGLSHKAILLEEYQEAKQQEDLEVGAQEQAETTAATE